ncbi:hypothetical protein D1AOALGA4SA_7322 [Olavius algarvensis Delta 1 endosymbiont]|nr:hypothetical protein D1AOALGA4SA_7322 [Olavius algarvensis Delta 1 endosymbiont]
MIRLALYGQRQRSCEPVYSIVENLVLWARIFTRPPSLSMKLRTVLLFFGFCFLWVF